MIARPDLADAEACAKGYKQLSLIRELAAGPVGINVVKTARFYFVRTYGKTGLPESSFRPMRDRLKEKGFSIVKANDSITVFR